MASPEKHLTGSPFTETLQSALEPFGRPLFQMQKICKSSVFFQLCLEAERYIERGRFYVNWGGLRGSCARLAAANLYGSALLTSLSTTASWRATRNRLYLPLRTKICRQLKWSSMALITTNKKKRFFFQEQEETHECHSQESRPSSFLSEEQCKKKKTLNPHAWMHAQEEPLWDQGLLRQCSRTLGNGTKHIETYTFD